MRFTSWRWIRLFFMQPIRVTAIVAALRRGFERRRRAPIDAQETRLEPPPVRHPPRGTSNDQRRAQGPASVGVEVSEQPLDTLPVELQAELSRVASRRRPGEDSGNPVR